MDYEVQAINERVERESRFIPELQKAIQTVIVGQRYLIDRLLIGVLCDGHVLIEGVPGLAKTLSVKTLASAINTSFQRIQFTPDLLPADLIGTQVYDPRDHSFTAKKGPIFSNIILADEINRAPAKVQSALLECMQERQVTIGEQTFPLGFPFLVMATQNPIEQEGTYPLPEAQVDRFMLKLRITYPGREEERTIMEKVTVEGLPEVAPVIDPDRLRAAQEVIRGIYIDEKVKNYILDIVFATRDPDSFNLPIKHLIAYGASPRASIYLAQAGKAHAFLRGRGYVTPEDIKSIGPDVLRHRVIVTYEAEAEEMDSEAVIQRVFDGIEVP
ncbi:MAG: AAA domain-containing protein [Candidatus Latescibacteria bacterium]|nr:AAA domain-containing protein [Candidatus Latescibacterota bacterium]NIM22528.1 AAA domain-containing protein [Candidatus Latescibacterota bacterium]NIM64842.1 AAA domain-containing protein [Candidatus Latescibacterota bacterium]NIO01350.1 AAA domain-containing protein [Candidatus Latescibacterota bacterium]NIO27839.1 AAA domain-containing protein [Candidatus Latescibacterota bacterium]